MTTTTGRPYTLEQIAHIGAAVALSGKMEEALNLLKKYKVKTVNKLKPEQYEAFVIDLFAIGAHIKARTVRAGGGETPT